ncbi:gamma-glutamyltransferase [Zafaria cholistanensis]|uniref:Gamma-glutamyltransferase n=1 Tax=Zafaria cholistanensis TaxID=1682741 RepID=A0A5A7NTQ2_9MICC|nr:gamma-glutamyltransferase [Zafaria cholistanensis]GER23131.1 gamma-glutamyltransferase [Zafaria cholistanensis]
MLREHAVAAAHPAAVDAGMEILEQGGNAADAAVATAFAVAVVEPFASGIGGGGSAVLAEAGAEPIAYDYREVVAQNGVIPKSGTGIPGFVAGLATIHEEHGKLEWKELLEPAIDLAEDGFPISGFLALRMKSDAGPKALEDLPQFKASAGVPLLREGDQLVQKHLAATMKTLAGEGPEAFYTGSLVDELSTVEGIDAASLAAYETEKLAPARGRFGDYDVVSAAPALPGAALIQMLQVAEAQGIEDNNPGSAKYVDRLTRAWSVADRSVNRYFGDPRFVDVPVERLTDAKANADLARKAQAAGMGANAPMAGAQPIVPGNTTHLTVVDSEGFTVSMTNTITNFWGGGKTGNVGGFFLNNQLSRFASLDTPNNQPEPGRKSVSWAAPSLVLDDKDRVVMGLGSPGGHQIPNILAGVLVPWALQDASLQKAVDAPRYHLQDGVLAVERDPSPELSQLIQSRGWQLQRTRRQDAVFGSVQALQIDYDSGRITGARDTRREADFAIAEPRGD